MEIVAAVPCIRFSYINIYIYIYKYIYIYVFGKRLSRKNDNVVVFPFAFHIPVQQPFKPLWSRLLLYELEPSRASFVLCFKWLLPSKTGYRRKDNGRDGSDKKTRKKT